MVDLRRPDYDRPRMLRHVDLALPLLTVMVALIGVVMVYSATRGPATDLRPAETFHLVRQARLAALGVVAMVAAGWFGHRRLHRFVPLVYLGMLGLLGAVLLVGAEVRGRQGLAPVRRDPVPTLGVRQVGPRSGPGGVAGPWR